jgi:arginase
MSYYIGYVSGIAAGNVGCKDGPSYLFKTHPFEHPKLLYDKEGLDKYAVVTDICTRLSDEVVKCIEKEKFFTVIGGDHACAIGTWSGAAHASRNQGDIGLIWIDAHFDAHTPATSLSGNIHGMPVAVLLGHGDERLIHIQDNLPKIKPESICMIGMRSYESGEQELIQKLNIKVFYMDEVLARGFESVFKEAKEIVTRTTIGYGISLDMDGIDPLEAPGVGTPEENGIPGQEVCDVFRKYCLGDKKLLGLELTEFNPHEDVDKKTEMLMMKLLEIFK